MIPTPPASFVRDLRAYDPELRVRWAVHSACWVIERKLPLRHKQLLAERPNPWKSPKGLDRYDGWRDGYVLVMFVHPDVLSWRFVAQPLHDADAHALGGFKRINDELDRLDDEEQRQQERQLAHWGDAAAKEAHDRLAWLTGRRVQMPGDPSGVEPSDRIEQHEGFRVRIRKAMVLTPSGR